MGRLPQILVSSLFLFLLVLATRILFSEQTEHQTKLEQLVQNMPNEPQQKIQSSQSNSKTLERSSLSITRDFSKALEAAQSQPILKKLIEDLTQSSDPLHSSLGHLILLQADPDSPDAQKLRDNGTASQTYAYLNTHPREALSWIQNQSDQLDPKDYKTRVILAKAFNRIHPEGARPEDMSQEMSEWIIKQPWEKQSRNEELILWIDSIEKLDPAASQSLIRNLYDRNQQNPDFNSFLEAQFNLSP